MFFSSAALICRLRRYTATALESSKMSARNAIYVKSFQWKELTTVFNVLDLARLAMIVHDHGDLVKMHGACQPRLVFL